MQVAHCETRKEEYDAGAWRRRRGGNKVRGVKGGRKSRRNRSLRQRHQRHGSKHPSSYSDRRKLANILLSRHRGDQIEQQTRSFPAGTISSRKSNMQSVISMPEKSGLGFSTFAASAQEKSPIVSTSENSNTAETDSRKEKSRRHGTKEMSIDGSLLFVSQLNQVAPQYNSAPAAKLDQNSGSMSKAISVLQQTGGKLSRKHKRIHSSICNERFLMATDLAYERIVKKNTRLELLFSIAEWRHVHALMLYARVFLCELAAENIDQPREFSIYLPDNLKVFEPLGVVLASIGIVEDKEGGLSYIPVAKPLQGKEYKPHDPNDVTVFMEWSQYKWNASWRQAKIERKRRKNDAKSHKIDVPEKRFRSPNDSKLHRWEHIALEMWLGWDEELWFNYEVFVDSVSRSFLFADFPNSTTGTYAWLIPSYRTTRGSYAKIPNPSIGNAVWMIALLFDLSDLPPQNTASWFCKTDTLCDMKATLLQFLDSALKS